LTAADNTTYEEGGNGLPVITKNGGDGGKNIAGGYTVIDLPHDLAHLFVPVAPAMPA